MQIPIDKQAISDFCRRYHIRRMAVFGSALRTDFSPASDVDLLVEFDPAHVPGFGFVSIQDELSALIGRNVDLSTPGFLSPFIRDRVARTAHNLYVAD